MSFYQSVAETGEEGIQQGDILASVPFMGFSMANAQILPPGEKRPRSADLTKASAELPDGTLLLANVALYNGIVLNQSCDLSNPSAQQKKPIVVARLLPPDERVKDFKSTNTAKQNAKAVSNIANPGKAPTLFYLPESERGGPFHLERSVADLLDVMRYRAEELEALTNRVSLRLSRDALQALQERLAYCFGRFGAPDGLYMSDEEWTEIYGSRERETA